MNVNDNYGMIWKEQQQCGEKREKENGIWNHISDPGKREIGSESFFGKRILINAVNHEIYVRYR